MNAEASLELLSAGALTTVQDLGRSGWRAIGVGAAGALDRHSAMLANLLVGNAADAAVLEITLSGPRLRVHGQVRIAITGADIEADAEGVPIHGWRPVAVQGPVDLRLGACRRGLRSYLAVAGGIDLAPVLGSRATDLRGGFGGTDGAALRRGARLPCATTPARPGAGRVESARWWIDPTPDLDLALPAVGRLLPGSAALAPACTRALFDSRWQVLPDSNRTGLRLHGPPLTLALPWQLPSEPVLPGTVQCPPDGRPIVLLGECGTVGGYPRIGHVDSGDLARLAQLRPGEPLRFAPTTLQECDRRACERSQRLARIALAIDTRQE